MSPLTTSALAARLDERRCSHCWLYLPSCGADAPIWASADDELFLDPRACSGCGDCVGACPAAALAFGPRGGA